MTPSVLDFTYHLADLPDRASYLAGARTQLEQFLPGDDIFWMETDYVLGTCTAQHGPLLEPDPDLSGRMVRAVSHPVIQSYFRNPSDRHPRRISDVTGPVTWKNAAARSLVETSMGKHQLSILTGGSGFAGRAWVFGRSAADFGDTALAQATALQPVLTLLDRLYPQQCEATFVPDEQALERSALTPRELDVLTLLARGLTADAIGRLRRISGHTVRKHLQNIYGKLGIHDRLLAVEAARRLGLVQDRASGGGNA